MNEKRREFRLENSLIPSDLCRVFLMLPDGGEIISKLVNISRLGMGLVTPTDEFFSDNNFWKKRIVFVNFPVKKIKVPAEFTYINTNSNGTLSIGVSFINSNHRKMFKEFLKSATDTRMLA